jgi:hypothetical protein
MVQLLIAIAKIISYAIVQNESHEIKGATQEVISCSWLKWFAFIHYTN